jgi:hypothetical protein
MQLSNEEDLFFLHSLEVSEEEFQTLKVEQGILVDFANFPGKVVGLLERCIASRAEETPKCGPGLLVSPLQAFQVGGGQKQMRLMTQTLQAGGARN